MKTINGIIENANPLYPLENIGPKEELLFLDIETTGLSPNTSNLYLIGVTFYREDKWQYIQWFADNYEEELQLLTAFVDFIKGFKTPIHYNGNKFDLPYLASKMQQFQMDFSFDEFNGVDIYRRIKGYRVILGLPDLKQQTVEQFLGFVREDRYTGRELISIYHEYITEKNPPLFDILLLHNLDDLRGMLAVVSMLSYPDLFLKPLRVIKAQANYFNTQDRKRCQEIIMKLRLTSPLPVPVSFRGKGCYFSGSDDSASLKVPLFEEEMKYFYTNYQDYYYLPAEDIAIHKNVASFVDKAHRVQASASNCYTRMRGLFLPQWEELFTPVYKREYRTKELFFELTDEFKRNREDFAKYATHILTQMYEDNEV